MTVPQPCTAEHGHVRPLTADLNRAGVLQDSGKADEKDHYALAVMQAEVMEIRQLNC